MMLIEIIQYLIPEAKVTVNGAPSNADEYEKNVIWHDARPQPSWNDIQAAVADATKAKENAQAKQARANDYRAESDPLFFGWQRGENTEQSWLDKVAEIRARYPYQA